MNEGLEPDDRELDALLRRTLRAHPAPPPIPGLAERAMAMGALPVVRTRLTASRGAPAPRFQWIQRLASAFAVIAIAVIVFLGWSSLGSLFGSSTSGGKFDSSTAASSGWDTSAYLSFAIGAAAVILTGLIVMALDAPAADDWPRTQTRGFSG